MKRSYLLALVVALVVSAWLLSGLYPELLARFGDPQRAAAQAPSPAAQVEPPPLPSVRVARSRAREYRQGVVVYGRTEAVRTVDIKAETAGRVVELPLARGAFAEVGEIIARLAMDEREARLNQARALARQREIEFNAAAKLKEKGYRAETSFAASQASLDAARAEVAAIEVDIAKTRIKAPFAGIVEDRVAELGAYLKVGEVVTRLVDVDPLLVVGQVSENDVDRLRIGAAGRAVLTGGKTVEGRIRYIAATANPETRTFRVEVEVPNPARRLREGLTAELRLPLEILQAHRLSPAVLTLDDDGRIGIRAVAADRRVRFHAVEIVGDDGDGVWLAGLPEVLDVIVVGQEYVRDGDLVTAVGATVPSSTIPSS